MGHSLVTRQVRVQVWYHELRGVTHQASEGRAGLALSSPQTRRGGGEGSVHQTSEGTGSSTIMYFEGGEVGHTYQIGKTRQQVGGVGGGQI